MNSDPRVARILGDWQRARDGGSAPQPRDVIAANPELAEELRAGFAMITALDSVYAHDRGGAHSFPAEVGPYKLLRELGSGGMGTVYEAAVHRETSGLAVGERVALKVVHPHLLARPGFFKRFLREAEAGRRVRHSKVISTLDADAREIDGRTHLYLVMEYVEGRTLRELLEELGVVPEALVRELATQLATALAGIHETGIVHRDLKPDNVIITPDNEVRVMDMGVARVDDDQGRLTEHGQFAGSLHYAAPEQFDAREVGPATDLYALGVLFYELLTGENPFRRDDAGSTMRAHLEEMPQRLDERDPALSRYISEVIATLLAKDPVERFTCAEDLQAVLEAGERSPWWAGREQALLEARPHIPTIPVRRETTLYGREADLELLASAWEEVRAGEGRFVLIEGEAGIGKSRLVDSFLHDLEGTEPHILYGSYPPGGGEGAITDALREHFGIAGMADALAPYLTVVPSLARPLAALLRHEPPPEESPSLEGDVLPAALCHLMRGLASEKPLIWIVEDLHAASEDSRKVLLSLARGLAGHRVLLLATTRPELPEEVCAGLARVPGYQRAILTRLGAREVILLLEEAFHSRRLAEKLGGRIALASDGVPFFVFEMIRGLREGAFVTQLPDGSWIETKEVERIEVPPAVRELVEARLRRFTDERRALLDVGAVIGHEFDPDLLARAIERPRLQVLQQLAGIERRTGVVRGHGTGFRFDHHQIQEVIYRDLHDALRSEYHTRVAEALLEREGAAETAAEEVPGSVAHLVARHHLRGIHPREGTPFLLPALEYLEREHAHGTAVALADLALDREGLLGPLPRAKVLLHLCNGPLRLIGDSRRHEQCAREAERLALELRDADLAEDATYTLALALGRMARHEEALVALDRMLASAEGRGDLAAQVRGNVKKGGVLTVFGRMSEALENLERGRELAQRIDDRLLEARALGNMGTVWFRREQPDKALALYQEAQALWPASSGGQDSVGLLANIAGVLEQVGRLQEAERRIEEAFEAAVACGDRGTLGHIALTLGNIRRKQGRLNDAERAYRDSLTAAQEAGNAESEMIAMGNLGVLYHGQGRFEEARGCLERALGLTSPDISPQFIVLQLVNLGTCDWDTGRLERARARFEEALGLSKRHALTALEGLAMLNLGNVWLTLGCLDGARDLVEGALRNTSDLQTAEAVAGATLILSSIESAEGRPDVAVTLAREALEISRGAKSAQGQMDALTQMAAHHLSCPNEPEAAATAREAIQCSEAAGALMGASTAYAVLAVAAPEEVESALTGYRAHEASLPRCSLPHARHLLWRATGDVVHLETARTALEDLVANAPQEYRHTMLSNVPLHREIMEAWAEHGVQGGAAE